MNRYTLNKVIQGFATNTARSGFMNIRSSSPGITLLYVFALLWILMGVDRKSLSKLQFRVTLVIMAFLCIFNHALFMLIKPDLYAKIMLLTMHLPTFFLFLYIGKRGVIKTAFMILTALAFSAPSTIISNILKNHIKFREFSIKNSSLSSARPQQVCC